MKYTNKTIPPEWLMSVIWADPPNRLPLEETQALAMQIKSRLQCHTASFVPATENARQE
jgi:hypothetical protein